ncbi:hypothetical protein B2J93_6636 [Marssonina coronariae]|uniref:Uncharacterized protein n=1 Tax=Diplocarpon coronariae TaxID=2795749 RepID=A0A218Z3J9_9HELO|nr:hypothetical protein B2J93_6636 [Marssonina coronariae]
MLRQSLVVAAAAGLVAAQNVSFCDKYTTALFMNNTAENQLRLLTAVVNTAVVGNYSESKTGTAVAGILAPGVVNGTAVDLLPYFNGGFASSNRGGSSGVSVNFLDDGGAVPLTMGKAANGTSSQQYMLLTHLYEYFGTLLGCSQQGSGAYAAYDGFGSQYEVHKFMDLSLAEVTYFIEQVAGAALSFGVSADDLAPVGNALMTLFGYRCSPPATVVPAQGSQAQSICQAEDCPLAPMSNCTGYTYVEPAVAVPSLVPNATASVTSSPNGTAPISNAAPAKAGLSLAAIAGGLVALLL